MAELRGEGRRDARGAVVRVLAVIAAGGALLWVIGGLLSVLLLGFAGLLLGLVLHGAGRWLARCVGAPVFVGVAAICLAVSSVVVLAGFAMAPAIAAQVDELARELPQAAERLTVSLEGYGWGRELLERARRVDDFIDRGDALNQAGGMLSKSIGGAAGFVAFLFIGLFVAFEADLYRKGLLRLVPLRRRQRIAQVLSEAAHVIRMWMAGKLVSMLVVGVLTWGGLALLGVPLGLTLAVLAAVLTFIPNFGPVLSVIPAALLGLLDGPDKALYIVLLYLGIQTVESYVLTPIVQKQTVALPPALTLLGQLVMGITAGGLGVVVATPLTAVGLVIVRRLYVEDTLGDSFDGSSPHADGGELASSPGAAESHAVPSARLDTSTT